MTSINYFDSNLMKTSVIIQGASTIYTEMQLTVGPVGPRGQNFRGSGK
jgi:hypothetical protein